MKPIFILCLLVSNLAFAGGFQQAIDQMNRFDARTTQKLRAAVDRYCNRHACTDAVEIPLDLRNNPNLIIGVNFNVGIEHCQASAYTNSIACSAAPVRHAFVAPDGAQCEYDSSTFEGHCYAK